MKSYNSHMKLGVLGAAALVTGGLMIALAPEAQTMRDTAGGNRSTHSVDKNDPRHDTMGNPMRTISSSVPVSRTTTAPDMMREPMTTGDTRR